MFGQAESVLDVVVAEGNYGLFHVALFPESLDLSLLELHLEETVQLETFGLSNGNSLAVLLEVENGVSIVTVGHSITLEVEDFV